jgi:hypothetical protein
MKKVRTIRIDRGVSEQLDSICTRHGDISWHIENALNAYFPVQSGESVIVIPEPSLPTVAKKPVKQFMAPTQQQVGNYFLERGSDDALNQSEKFWDFYASKNWMVGKNKMKAWKAAARNWMRSNNERQQSANKPSVKQSIGNAIHGNTANNW